MMTSMRINAVATIPATTALAVAQRPDQRYQQAGVLRTDVETIVSEKREAETAPPILERTDSGTPETTSPLVRAKDRFPERSLGSHVALLISFIGLSLAILVAGCSTTSRVNAFGVPLWGGHSGTTHIAVSGTAGGIVTGFYVQDGRRVTISNAVPWTVDVPRMSHLEVRAPCGSDVVLDLRYESAGCHMHNRYSLGANVTGARARVQDGFIVKTY